MNAPAFHERNCLSKLIAHNQHDDGVDRRGFLQCMAWAGTGIIWTIEAGIPTSRVFGKGKPAGKNGGGLSFVQISDSHIGFNKPANPDVTGTLQAVGHRYAPMGAGSSARAAANPMWDSAASAFFCS